MDLAGSSPTALPSSIFCALVRLDYLIQGGLLTFALNLKPPFSISAFPALPKVLPDPLPFIQIDSVLLKIPRALSICNAVEVISLV